MSTPFFEIRPSPGRFLPSPGNHLRRHVERGEPLADARADGRLRDRDHCVCGDANPARAVGVAEEVFTAVERNYATLRDGTQPALVPEHDSLPERR